MVRSRCTCKILKFSEFRSSYCNQYNFFKHHSIEKCLHMTQLDYLSLETFFFSIKTKQSHLTTEHIFRFQSIQWPTVSVYFKFSFQSHNINYNIKSNTDSTASLATTTVALKICTVSFAYFTNVKASQGFGGTREHEYLLQGKKGYP